jgi:DNA-binding response OmpR family regulator
MSGKPRILLVDDEPSLVKVVGKRLEVEGFDVSVAMDGEEALAQVAATRPQLIILDVMLPKLNGHEVCRKLKWDARYQKIPIIMFTAKVQEKDEKIGFEAGADGYIRKPFRAPELIEKIRALLAEHRPPDGG